MPTCYICNHTIPSKTCLSTCMQTSSCASTLRCSIINNKCANVYSFPGTPHRKIERSKGGGGGDAVGLDHRETTLKNDLQVKYLGVLEAVFESNLEY